MMSDDETREAIARAAGAAEAADREEMQKALERAVEEGARSPELDAWDQFRQKAGTAIQSALVALNNSVSDAIRNYAADMSRDLTEALQTGDEQVVREIGAQARALAEQQRIVANKQGLRILGVIIDGLIDFGLLLLNAYLPPQSPSSE